MRIPNRSSEPEPDLSLLRGGIEDYRTRRPGPGDIALVVEITRTTAAKDRGLANVYSSGDIPFYWILDLVNRRLEVHDNLTGGNYSVLTILEETDSVDLIIDGRVPGRSPWPIYFPRP